MDRHFSVASTHWQCDWLRGWRFWFTADRTCKETKTSLTHATHMVSAVNVRRPHDIHLKWNKWLRCDANSAEWAKSSVAEKCQWLRRTQATLKQIKVTPELWTLSKKKSEKRSIVALWFAVVWLTPFNLWAGHKLSEMARLISIGIETKNYFSRLTSDTRFRDRLRM